MAEQIAKVRWPVWAAALEAYEGLTLVFVATGKSRPADIMIKAGVIYKEIGLEDISFAELLEDDERTQSKRLLYLFADPLHPETTRICLDSLRQGYDTHLVVSDEEALSTSLAVVLFRLSQAGVVPVPFSHYKAELFRGVPRAPESV